MINHSRYITIREKILFLYNILNNRSYRVWVAPKTLMSIDELRDRSHVTFEGSLGDPTYYSEPQLKTFTIPKLIDILPNAAGIGDFGFNDPNHTIVEIYESVQEYIALWCEIIVNTNEFKTPPKEELRKLETLAWFIYPLYKKIKPFKLNNDIRVQIEADMEVNKRGLAGLGILFGHSNRLDDLSFISHLDNLDSPSDFGSSMEVPEYMPIMQPPPQPMVTGGLAAIESEAIANGEWLFRG